jgi:hypothetical protein
LHLLVLRQPAIPFVRSLFRGHTNHRIIAAPGA